MHSLVNQGHVDEFKSNVSLLVNISKIVDQTVNTAVALSRLSAGKLVVASAKILTFKNKNGAFKKRFAHFTEDEIGELLVEEDSTNSHNTTNIVIKVWRIKIILSRLFY